MSVTSEIRGRTNDAVPEQFARQALAKVLASEIFARSQQQSKLLKYLCAHYFEGTSDGLKEYSVATEVMGLDDNYDQAEGSTVRVALHRLRKRLKTYYETEGRKDAIEIRLNAGDYTPEFHERFEGAEAASAIPLPASPAETSEALPEKSSVTQLPSTVFTADAPGISAKSTTTLIKLVILLGILTITAVGIFGLYSRFHRTVPRSSALPVPVATTASTTVSDLPQGEAVRIMAGAKQDEYTDPSGNIWLGDRFYDGGEAHTMGTSERAQKLISVKRAGDQVIVRHFRSGFNFSYAIPVQPGIYEVLMGFVENTYGPDKPAGGGENRRVFTVKINGEVVIDHLDIFSDAPGADTLDAKRFANVRPMGDGKIHLTFSSSTDNPAVLSYLELLPQIGVHPNPIRIGTRTKSFVDNLGRVWDADNYYLGGQLAPHLNHVTDTSVPELYETERYGNFSYDIPVDRNRAYRVTLYFSEDYFGTPDHGQENQHARIFDVTCNETTLLRDFDILKEAGVRDRAVVKVFSGLKASAQGRLSIAFVPSRNYAMVDAIEITEDKP